jgi:dolichol-phosphate mannosyltransferase
MAAMNVSVIIPCYKERESLEILLPQLRQALPFGDEILVVWDGTDDGTERLCLGLGVRSAQGRGLGLGAAILDGIAMASNDRVVVMDGDGQHPVSAVYRISEWLQDYPLASGRRLQYQGFTWSRRFMSEACRWLAKPLCPQQDIMTGLFGLDRRIIDLDDINHRTWKIGLEIFVKGRYSRYTEEDYYFMPRYAGESKAGLKPALQFLAQLVRLYAWKVDLTQMLKFCIVGTSGLLVNVGLLTALVELAGMDYRPAAVLGIGTAMVWNYLWNKFWTFRKVHGTTRAPVAEPSYPKS